MMAIELEMDERLIVIVGPQMGIGGSHSYVVIAAKESTGIMGNCWRRFCTITISNK